ncbi:MAG: hypothetical protein PHW12_03375 [Smithella sp.]|jgi:hypothetical protein|nr:hypothetical protein [Smithella sp.]
MNYNKTIFQVFAVLTIITAALTVVNLATAQDSTIVIPAGNPSDYLPPWLITLLQVAFVGTSGSALSLFITKWVEKKFPDNKKRGIIKFLATGVFLIAIGVLAAIFAGKSNITEFVGYAFSAAIAVYNVFLKKRD